MKKWVKVNNQHGQNLDPQTSCCCFLLSPLYTYMYMELYLMKFIYKTSNVTMRLKICKYVSR